MDVQCLAKHVERLGWGGQMRAFLGKFGLKVKRFIVDVIVEPLIPLRRLESYLVFWARFVFRLRKPFVIGITGSVGKSTTTAMIAAALSHQDAAQFVGPVGHTFDNMNDDVGVSATLLRFESFLCPSLGLSPQASGAMPHAVPGPARRYGALPEGYGAGVRRRFDREFAPSGHDRAAECVGCHEDRTRSSRNSEDNRGCGARKRRARPCGPCIGPGGSGSRPRLCVAARTNGAFAGNKGIGPGN